jgi:signal transduction histidine kinase
VLFREPGKFRRIDVINGNGQRFAFLLDKEQFAQDQSPLLLWVVTLILVIISSVYALQASQLRPLKWLGAGVDAVSRGDFSIRVPVVRKDEIGEVAHSFNLMAERVQQMLDDRERLLADVSHELRSPLARIKVAVDLLPEGDKKGLIARDIIEMESLIAVLLEREQLKNNLSNITNESVNPVVLVADIIDSLNSAEPMIELNVGTGDLKFIGDAALVKVLIQNLLDNACKFSLPDSQPVVVSIDRKEKNIIITIEDDGIGVPEDKLEEILEAFVKLDPARGHRVGYGLGLNLCQRIMQAHDGGIRIENRECGGTRIVVTFGLN